MKRYHVYIEGRVQGVFFRASTKQEADRLNVKGWTQNLPDGRVEVVMEGDSDETVEKLLAYVKQGPKGSVVENVTVEEEMPEGLDDFVILR